LEQRHIKVNLKELPANPGLQASIFDRNTISSHEKERVQRAYLHKGPCHPYIKKTTPKHYSVVNTDDSIQIGLTSI